MGDSIFNALQSQNRSSSVLGAIANPATVNPLAAIGAGTQLAGNILDLRSKQADQAWGQALQQATDPTTGVVDFNKAQGLAAQNPAATMGMARNLQNTSNIRGQQIQQAGQLYGLVGQMSASVMKDPSDQNLAAIRAQAVNSGLPASAIAEIDRIQALPVDQRANEAYNHNLGALDALGRLHQTVGQTTLQPLGNVAAPVTVNQPTPGRPGSATVGPGAVTVGPAPGTRTEAVVPMDDQGVIPQDANGVPARTPKTWQKISVPGSPGVPGGGQQVTPPPASGSGPPQPPPPPSGTQPRVLSPGAYKPPGSAATPATTTTPETTPPVVTPPTTQPPAPVVTPPATPTTATPIVRSEPPQGQPAKQSSDVAAYTQDQAAFPDVQTRGQNLAHAYDALNQLKSATGKGAAGINDLRSYAQTLGILPQGAVNEQQLFEIVRKYTDRAMLDAAGGGSTDLGKRLQGEASPGTLLSTGANAELMRNDMGKTLQTMAAYKDQGDKTGTGYLENRAKLADATDPRGFVWNLYSPDEQAKINAEVAKNPVAADKLHKAIGMSQRLNLQIPGLTSAPQKQSFLTAPPAPQPNALAMTG